MDFRQTIQPNSPRPAANNTPQPAHSAPGDSNKTPVMHSPHPVGSNQWLKILTLVVLVGIAILLGAIAFGVRQGTADDSEYKYVNTSKYQAVFLNNGQVYFGNIKTLDDTHIRMTDIYYLTQSSDATDSKTTNGDYSLIKLGCQQIHNPYDAMVINRGEVTFWENLQDDGKVVSTIKEFKKKNPNGPDCSKVSNETQASSSAAQGTTNTKQ